MKRKLYISVITINKEMDFANEEVSNDSMGRFKNLFSFHFKIDDHATRITM